MCKSTSFFSNYHIKPQKIRKISNKFVFSLTSLYLCTYI